MTDDQANTGNAGQKIKAGLFVVVLGVVIWQVWGLFGGGASTPAASTQQMNAQAMQNKPMPAVIQAKPQELTEREKKMMQDQEALQAKYVAAVNELQMLKIQNDISTTNKNIMKDKYDTVKSQKDIVDLLTAPPKPEASQSDYARGLMQVGGVRVMPGMNPGQSGAVLEKTPPSYLVISITQLRGQWGAVLGYDNKLYQITVGDVLPTDGSKVVSIDDSTVTLEDKDGKELKLSLVSII